MQRGKHLITVGLNEPKTEALVSIPALVIKVGELRALRIVRENNDRGEEQWTLWMFYTRLGHERKVTEPTTDLSQLKFLLAAYMTYWLVNFADDFGTKSDMNLANIDMFEVLFPYMGIL